MVTKTTKPVEAAAAIAVCLQRMVIYHKRLNTHKHIHLHTYVLGALGNYFDVFSVRNAAAYSILYLTN